MSMNVCPLVMTPAFRHGAQTPWGGHALKELFGKDSPEDITGESLEVSALPGLESRVAGGEYAGKTLREMLTLWGKSLTGLDGDGFPLLLKILDTRECLSVQVHPDDAYALSHEGKLGKSEAWYILDAAPGAELVYGINTQGQSLRSVLDAGKLESCLRRTKVQAGDVFYILPGTIHAVGAGIVIAEIQQNSNTTFRVYDYRRRDASGNLRPLHLERAAEVLNYDPLIPSECKANGMTMLPGFRMTEMFSCRYFRAYKLDIETEARLYCDGTSFHHLLCVEGEAVITADGKDYPVRRGESYFIPAAMGEYQVRGASRVLLSRV